LPEHFVAQNATNVRSIVMRWHTSWLPFKLQSPNRFGSIRASSARRVLSIFYRHRTCLPREPHTVLASSGGARIVAATEQVGSRCLFESHFSIITATLLTKGTRIDIYVSPSGPSRQGTCGMSAIETPEATSAGSCSPAKLGGRISIALWTSLIAIAHVSIALPKSDHLILTNRTSERLVSILWVHHRLWISSRQLQTSSAGCTIQNFWRSSYILVVSLPLLMLTTSAPSLLEIHRPTTVATDTKIAMQRYGSIIRGTQTSEVPCDCSIQLVGLGTGTLKAFAHLGKYWSHDFVFRLLTCRHLVAFGLHLAP
jgi:hypothetical protein